MNPLTTSIATATLFISLLLAALWWLHAHKKIKHGFLSGKSRAPGNEVKKIRGEYEVEMDYRKIQDRISDISRGLCDHSERFCLEASAMFSRWVAEHIDDYVYDHPNKIIELGEPRVTALKEELNQLKRNMQQLVSDSLLGSNGGAYLDDIDPLSHASLSDADAELQWERDPVPVRNEMATTRVIDHKFSVIAGCLGNIMASYGLIAGNHQRWIRLKGADHYQYTGAILWTDSMRAHFSDYMTLKTEYREYKAKIPALLAERLRIEAKNMWSGKPMEPTRSRGAWRAATSRTSAEHRLN